jgi:Pentapeptide repeats (8 copies)
VIAPIFLLLTMQVQFLPYHDSFITSAHRVVLLADLILVWWLWRKILSGRETDRPRRAARRAWTGLGIAFSLAALLFSWTVATFPGEGQENYLPSVRLLPTAAGNSERVSLHDWIFNSSIDDSTHSRWLPFSSTLILSRLNIYEGRKIDDPDKANWRDYLFRANDRDLKGAIFDLASLPKVDFTGSSLEGASLNSARLQGASLDRARLQGASLDYAQLQGASLFEAQLQGATLDDAELQGASLNRAQLQGASLEHAQLQGASLAGAQLQGASLQLADLLATDLSSAALWRTNRQFRYADELTTLAAVRLPDSPDRWRPTSADLKPWNEQAYRTRASRWRVCPLAHCATRRWRALGSSTA